jgi:hypothetical protein
MKNHLTQPPFLARTIRATVAGGLGFGRLLMQAVETCAQARQLPGIVLSASLNAVSFYTRLGYKRGQPSCAALPQGIAAPFLNMSKTFGQ